MSLNLKQQRSSRDYPVGSVVKNLPASAGDMGLITDRERSHAHAAEQLRMCAVTIEPVL